jgi:hypothetical protein
MMSGSASKTQSAVAIVCVLLFPLYLSYGQAPAVQQPGPLLSSNQLDNLVASVALYPDPLLGQVLAASTYPLEIAEAQQWLQQNRNLQGAQLVDVARQQNWDPSVQALVAFPDALGLLGNDLRWTRDLGDAFLAQQADVMSAVQRMRARASANGRLQSTPQQVVTQVSNPDTQNGQSAIEIQPADPQVMYVPVYQPDYVWGPPEGGGYPDEWYPPGAESDFGFGFAPGIFAGAFFPGWGDWDDWGWGCGWFGNGLFVNAGFFNRYGFRGGFGGRFGERGFGGRTAWTHDPAHRMGVSYPNQAVATRFHSNSFNGSRMNYGQSVAGGRFNSGAALSNRGSAGVGSEGGWRHFGGGSGAAAGAAQSYRAPAQGYRAYSAAPQYRTTPSYNRSFGSAYSAPRQSFSAPRGQSFAAPRSSGGFSGARSSGFSGGHSGSSGGHGGGGGRRR